MNTINELDDLHKETLSNAISNVLRTEIAESTFAQILDGLPTEETLLNLNPDPVSDHPVFVKNHVNISDGILDKVRELRTKFDVSELQFENIPLIGFQKSAVGSQTFNLRLIELVAVACHQLGAHLYDLDQGAHSHQEFEEFKHDLTRQKESGARPHVRIPPTPFFHPSYGCYQQYPRGLADIVGYWAETRIFGGVVLFDRGETDTECQDIWLHGNGLKSPTTLYPPTKEQFTSLVDFLLAPIEQNKEQSPLPINATRLNRPRWHPYHAFAEHHIFRDRYERELPPRPPPSGCVTDASDWPELQDQYIIMRDGMTKANGEPFNTPAEIAAAKVNIKNITKSSPLWRDPNAPSRARDWSPLI